jgi:ribosomal protein L24
MFKTTKWRICRDDIVCILSGADKGKTGRVLEVFRDARVPQVIVEGRNLVRQSGSPEDALHCRLTRYLRAHVACLATA